MAPHVFPGNVHLFAPLLQRALCPWDGIAEGHQHPHRQLQQGRAISDSRAACAKNTDFAAGEAKRQGGLDPAGREERRTNKVRVRQGILGNRKCLI